MALSTEHIHIIDAFSPIRVQFQTDTVSDAEFVRFLEGQTSSIKEASMSRDAVIMICDTAAHVNTPSTQRRLQAEWLKQHQLALKTSCMITYLVMPGSVRRGIMTAVLWLVEVPVPLVTCPTLEDAAQRALAFADSHGVKVPEAFRLDPGGSVRHQVQRVSRTPGVRTATSA